MKLSTKSFRPLVDSKGLIYLFFYVAVSKYQNIFTVFIINAEEKTGHAG